MIILSDEELQSLSETALKDYYYNLCNTINEVIFKVWVPSISSESRFKIFNSNYHKRKSAGTSTDSNDEYIENILLGTATSHDFLGRRPKVDLKKTLKPKLLKEVEQLLNCYRVILDRYKMELYEEAGIKIDMKKLEAEGSDQEAVNLAIANAIKASSQDDDRYVKPEEVTEEKILATLESSLFADIIKLNDKYAIRIGDGKFFVASDEIKVILRDPSQRPSWAIWFLSAVPLDKIPDRASLLLLPEAERATHMPEEIPDQLIVCHASLWKMKGNKTGILLHTSWNHIAATYRWVIDKPIDVASVLFKAVSHPAHLARNFGYIPNLAIPGDNWFL